MLIRKIDPQNIETQLAAIPAEQIACCNWAKDFPYTPKVTMKLAHTGERLIVRFEVEEDYTMARVERDNGEVWTDSCVETFIALDDKGYYNFEATCIGRLLLAYRIEREVGIEHACQEVLDKVKRYPSLPASCFEERVGKNHWTLRLEIPATALFRHNLTKWNGVKARMNLYKCGDKLSHPHFLSWKPIEWVKPDFHRPEFFVDVEFEA